MLTTMTGDPEWIRQAFLYFTNSKSRVSLLKLIVHVMYLLIPYERPLYNQFSGDKVSFKDEETEGTPMTNGYNYKPSPFISFSSDWIR